MLIHEIVERNIVCAMPRAVRDGTVRVADDDLTAREREILQLVADGMTNGQIAGRAVGLGADGQVPPLERLSQARRVEPDPGEPLRAHERPDAPPRAAARGHAASGADIAAVRKLTRRMTAGAA